MNKIALIVAGCFLFATTKAQSNAQLLEKVRTTEQAEAFVEKYKSKEAKLFSISANKDTADILLPLYSKKAGYAFSFEKYSYRIITSTTHPEFRVNYIFLDGSQLSIKEVDSLRSLIISRYKTGTPFYELVSEYSMDGNVLGDTFWFSEGMMVKDFETAVRKHKKGDVFTVDVPDNKWHYVVLKTYSDRIIEDLSILKIRTN